jgi:P27 family predicted phage terminase small subunit
MPARRSQLKLLDPKTQAKRIATDAQVGGLGLDFDEVPADVVAAPDAAAEWARLAERYKNTPVRFREGDRSAVTAYVTAFAVFQLAARKLLADGLIVSGRSSADRGRQVKSPSLAVWTQASAQLRYWARELGLTPDSRIRMGLIDDTKEDRDEARRVFGDDLLDNPFA